MPFEIIIVLLLILANGLLAMSEIAVVSSRRARLQERASAGDVGSRAALDLAVEPTRFLSTIQIGITLVGILAGAFGGTTVAKSLAEVLRRVDWLAANADSIGIGIVVVVITYLELVFGELVPKRLALNDPERVAASSAPPMKFLSRLAAPAVQLLTLSTELVMRLLGIRAPVDQPASDEEIRILLNQGTRAGVFDPAEEEIVKRVFFLSDQKVRSLITPRTAVVALDVHDPPDKIREKIETNLFSRFPVIDGSLDNVLGMVRAKDLLAQILARKTIDLRAGMHPPLLLPENMPALKVLEQFKQHHTHTAIVIDEYGGMLGIVSMTDLLEGIVGEIALTEEPGPPEIVQREDGSYLIDGTLSIQEFTDLFRLRGLDDAGDYDTVGGFVMASLGRVPGAGDRFQRNGLKVEVMDMDGARVDKVLVSKEEPAAEGQ